MGSKARIAKHILPVMLAYRKDDDQLWVEPFVGGGNIIDKVGGNRLGCDIDQLTIRGLSNIIYDLDRLPKNSEEFTEEMYKARCKGTPYEWLEGYAAYNFSFGAKKWGGWARDSSGKRDRVAESYRDAIKQNPKLVGVRLVCIPYDQITLNSRDKAIIYCDPPYEGTTEYANKRFDHNKFWGWCRKMTKEGHTVFVSEYKAPEGFKCLWEKELTNQMSKRNNIYIKATEKLFICEE